jgi:biotin carboxylase
MPSVLLPGSLRPHFSLSLADLRTLEQATAAAETVGFPLMVKASEGGGGKGIRKVEAMADLEAAFRQVRAVNAAWPNDAGTHMRVRSSSLGTRPAGVGDPCSGGPTCSCSGVSLPPSDVPCLRCNYQVQAEIPGSPVFIMKLAPRARHLEVQLLADE